MTTVTLTQARAHLSEVVDQARIEREPVYLTKRNRPVAAVIASERLAQLLATEAEHASTTQPPQNTPTESEAERLRFFEELAARAARHIKPGTPPLIDIDDFYQKRAPRL